MILSEALPPLPPSSVPIMAPDKARGIARGLRWLAQSYTEAGMAREATIALPDSEWWLAYAISLAQTQAKDGET